MTQEPTQQQRPNTMHFVGYVEEIIPPRQIISNGRVHLVRMIIVREEQRDGFTQGGVALQLPDKFFVSKIEPLREYKVLTDFGFYSKAVRKNDSCFSVLNCISIRPVKQGLYRKYNQVLEPRKKRQHKPMPPRVDDKGYKYPYNY